MFETELDQILKAEGASLVGFCKLDKPVNGLSYAVSIGYKLRDSILSTISDKPTMMYFQHYRIVNTKLDLLALDALTFIENKGYKVFPVAASQSTGEYTGFFQHKTAAVKSGLGYLGRNCLLITPQYGSKVRFCTVLTDMPLECQSELVPFSCGECRACVTACPAGAISGKTPSESMNRDEFFDAGLCSKYMKNFHDIGRGSVCGLCIKACPKNNLK